MSSGAWLAASAVYAALAARPPPPDTLDLLNRYLTLESDAVERQGGSVADLFGDGVFAFFGAPVTHPDDRSGRFAPPSPSRRR